MKRKRITLLTLLSLLFLASSTAYASSQTAKAGSDKIANPPPGGLTANLKHDAGSGTRTALPADSGIKPDEESDQIIAAVREYVQAQPGLATQFDVVVDAIEENYARTTVHSIEPPGGFSTFVKREAGVWQVILIGSGINPYDLYLLGVPYDLLHEMIRMTEARGIVDVTYVFVAALTGASAEQVWIDVQMVELGYARVGIRAPDPNGQIGGFTGYLKREEGNWTMLGIGSAFNSEELNQWAVPESLWP